MVTISSTCPGAAGIHWLGESSNDDTAVFGIKVDYQAPNAHEDIDFLLVKRIWAEQVRVCLTFEFCIAHVSGA